MRRALRSVLLCWAIVAFGVVWPASQAAAADPMRDFVMSCTYGTLAGTLVGAAALAFTDRPGDNLNLIARGASIGLYGGILLGLYVISGSDGGEDDAYAPGQSGALSPGGLAPATFPRLAARPVVHRPEARFALVPILSAEHGLEGGQFQMAIARF